MYNQRRYLTVDPRFSDIEATTMPVLWDQRSERGRNPITDRCLDDFERFGVRSGIMFMVHTTAHQSVVCAFNSARPEWDETGRMVLSMRIGDLVLFGQAVHEYLMLPVLARVCPDPSRDNLRMSRGEREVYTLLAQGDGTAEIARKLGKSESAVQKLVDSARVKFKAPNRTSALAAALMTGEIAYGAHPTPNPR